MTKKVYVSSTYNDLVEHRAAVKAELERAGFDVECMENYPAFDERPKDKCLADVAECDYYVLIVALRYGFQPKNENPGKRSITHLEYQEAVRLGKPCLPFLLDENHPWPPTRCDPTALSPRSRIGKFRQHIEDTHGRRVFTTPDSLAAAVVGTLRAREQKDGKGPQGDPVRIRADYLAWLRTSCESVDLLGLDLKESQNVRLGQVYVPAVTLARAGPESSERVSEERHALLLHRAGEESLYVPGAPGAGKSTFCRWLALVTVNGNVPGHPIPAAHAFQEQLPNPLRGRFPLLCGFRDWAGQTECLAGNGHWTQAQLEHSLSLWLEATRPGGLTTAVFREELAAGRCLLILDGVDEVPESIPGGHLPRRNLITGLADALPAWLAGGNRVLLTSRPYGLTDADRRAVNLPAAELAELPEPLQDTFIRRWYAAADPPRAEEKAEGLLGHLAERQDLRELRGNPMLLTALCVMYDQGQRLPQDFYALYEALVGQVLYRRYPDPNEQFRVRLRLEAIALGMHRGTTERRATPSAEVDIEEIDRHLTELSKSNPVTESGAIEAAKRREDLLSKSGLLLPKSRGRAAFYHLSFQEFLAAGRLRSARQDPKAVVNRYAAAPAWHRTLRFLFCAIADKESPDAAMDGFDCLRSQLDPAALDRDPQPALLLADCLEVAHGRGWTLSGYAKPLRQSCNHSLAHLNPPTRMHLWRTLGRLGLDDRPGVGLKDGLPDIDWVEVPAGRFLYGDGKREKNVPVFCIARYPVTNAQYQAFIGDGGCRSDAWWEGLAERPEPERGGWTDPNHPRETVSWFEAMAYSRWLDARLRAKSLLPAGWTVRLPTEEEWEKAARGTDGREFPWGDFETGRANVDETWDHAGPHNLGQTAAVGLYPAGASPCGALDMAGNVWEWCLNEYWNPDRTGAAGEARRVVRGGSWYGLQALARCAFRPYSTPDLRAALSVFGW